MVLLVDNYDSFTYNLVQRLGEIDAAVELRVVRNDRVTLDEIEAARPTHLIISPGPCTPVQAGVSNDVIMRFAARIPLLGVCLGHQCIGHALGARVVRAGRIMHGKTSLIHHDGRGVYRGLSNPFEATRYHSLVIEPGTLPEDLEVVAWTDQDEIMGVRHKQFPLEGVQFHPESFLTEEGIKLLKNFLDQGTGQL
jgi:para-aminobenzoate synthetase component 2